MNQDTGRRSGLRQAGLFFLLAVIVSYWKHEHELDSFLRNGSDSLGYYQWLPALLIEGRLDAMPWTYVLENGQGLSLFNMGVALLQLPFFLIGHAWALVSGAEANGWSAPYAVAQFAAAAFYLALGCLFVFRALRRYHDERTALWTTTMLYLGTNLFYYASFEPGMSHVYAFFLFCGGSRRSGSQGRRPRCSSGCPRCWRSSSWSARSTHARRCCPCSTARTAFAM